MSPFIKQNLDEVGFKTQLQSYKKIYRIDKQSSVKRWAVSIIIILILVLFLPWTQNIKAKGTITTLTQTERPQEINTTLAGKVVKWFVNEGNFVKKGDTILQLGEVKVDYFDPELLNRTKQQIEAKQQAAQGYKSKAITATTQMQALLQAKDLKLQSLDNKLQQQQLKVASDSMDVIAVANELLVYKRQLDAGKIMLDSGAISLIDFEKRRINYQNGFAKKISSENKFIQNKQELIGLRIEKNSAEQEYIDKSSKAEGDKFSTLSTAASTEADISKLQNIYTSYDIRNKLYYILAPQDGQITKAKKAGIGEFMKEGEMVVEIVPNNIAFAVELFIEPMDLPLIGINEKVRFVFDGFPAIVFSGWPKNSFGTFGGIVAAIETNISTNGKFRILVAQDTSDKDKRWPQNLKIGGGAVGIALLKDVRIGYELWRNINGFPPEYYKQTTSDNKEKKKDK